MPRPGNKRFVAVTTAADKAAVELRGIVRQIFGTEGLPPGDPRRNQYFVAELIPVAAIGTTPATHYYASGEIDNASYNALLNVTNSIPSFQVFEYDEVADFGFAQRKIAELGLKPRSGMTTLPDGTPF